MEARQVAGVRTPHRRTAEEAHTAVNVRIRHAELRPALAVSAVIALQPAVAATAVAVHAEAGAASAYSAKLNLKSRSS